MSLHILDLSRSEALALLASFLLAPKDEMTEAQSKAFRADTTSTIIFSPETKQPIRAVISTEYVNVPFGIDAPNMRTPISRAEFEDESDFIAAMSKAVITHKEVHDDHGIQLHRHRIQRFMEGEQDN